jgi:glucose-1-phosphate thymidylyltransferase
MLKGIILAGGQGTRLRPATNVANKHLIPILNKPMILYPIETLKSFGIKEILVVSGGDHIGGFAEFLGDGSEYDVEFTYKVQQNPGGIAEALGLAEQFAAGDDVLVILGDNIFDVKSFNTFDFESSFAHVYVKQVPDPQRFGVVEIDGDTIVSIEEKPKEPKSDKIITGLYHYPNSVFDIIKELKPSDRGELEISDVNNEYLNKGLLKWRQINYFWGDAGTPKSLFEATEWAFNK